MNKKEIFDYFSDRYYYHQKPFYGPDDDLYELLDDKKIQNFEFIESNIGSTHRWGHYTEDIYKINDEYVKFMIYVHSGDYGDNYLQKLTFVKPVKKVIEVTEWVDIESDI